MRFFCCQVYDQGASTALLPRFYYVLAVSTTIRVILTKISNRSGIAVQWYMYWGLRRITRSTILLAGTGVRKISSVAVGFSSV